MRKVLHKQWLYLLIILLFCFVLPVFADADQTIKLNKSTYTGLGDVMTVEVKAPEFDKHKNVPDFISIQVSTSENPAGYSIYAQETDQKTGVFSSTIYFNLYDENATKRVLKIRNGSKIKVSFNGISAEAVWKPGDATVKLDKAAYGGIGERPKITVTDNDLNADINNKDMIEVLVSSASDIKGITVKLTETKYSSGVFEGDFGFSANASDSSSKLLKVAYNDTITVSYTDKLNTSDTSQIKTANAVWKPASASLKFSSSKYAGLASKATLTLQDKDLNTSFERAEYTYVRISSGSDPSGFNIRLNETGISSGTFEAKLSFSGYATRPDKNVIKINPKDTIVVSYTDSWSNDGRSNVLITTSSGFEYLEGSLKLSSDCPSGLGSSLTVSVGDPDANTGTDKDNVRVDIKSTSDPGGISLWIPETGNSTGKFEGKIYFSVKESNAAENTIKIAAADEISVAYADTTLPDGGRKELVGTARWDYHSAEIMFDKEAYSGYGSKATITIKDTDANASRDEYDYIDVRISAGSSRINVQFKETGKDTGEFKGTLLFGTVNNAAEKRLKVTNGKDITVEYKDRNGKDSNVVEASVKWSYHNAELTLDKENYTGYKAQVNVTLKDYDLDDNTGVKDEVTVIAKVAGKEKGVSVKLTETGNNTGIFTGKLYINGSGKTPSVTMGAGDQLVVEYRDKETTEGHPIDRTDSAFWSTSAAELKLNSSTYSKYDTYLNIELKDPDQNKNSLEKDKVFVDILTQHSRSTIRVELTETNKDTGVFTGKVKLVGNGPGSGKLVVYSTDEIEVTFKDIAGKKEVKASAEFLLSK